MPVFLIICFGLPPQFWTTRSSYARYLIYKGLSWLLSQGEPWDWQPGAPAQLFSNSRQVQQWSGIQGLWGAWNITMDNLVKPPQCKTLMLCGGLHIPVPQELVAPCLVLVNCGTSAMIHMTANCENDLYSKVATPATLMTGIPTSFCI